MQVVFRGSCLSLGISLLVLMRPSLVDLFLLLCFAPFPMGCPMGFLMVFLLFLLLQLVHYGFCAFLDKVSLLSPCLHGFFIDVLACFLLSLWVPRGFDLFF